MARTVLLGEFAASTAASQRLTCSSWSRRPLVTVPVRTASRLATFARAKRTQLEALEAAGMTASLRLEEEGRTRLASLLPAREKLPEAVARRAVRRVFTLHQPRAIAVRVERG